MEQNKNPKAPYAYNGTKNKNPKAPYAYNGTKNKNPKGPYASNETKTNNYSARFCMFLSELLSALKNHTGSCLCEPPNSRSILPCLRLHLPYSVKGRSGKANSKLHSALQSHTGSCLYEPPKSRSMLPCLHSHLKIMQSEFLA
jgi:hypothetical protein